MKVVLLILLSVLTNNVSAEAEVVDLSVYLNDPEAREEAKSLSKAMYNALKGKSNENIEDYFHERFAYLDCDNEFVPRGVLLKKLNKVPFFISIKFDVKEAYFMYDNIMRFRVRLGALGQYMLFDFFAEKNLSIKGKYVLMSGIVEECKKRRFFTKYNRYDERDEYDY